MKDIHPKVHLYFSIRWGGFQFRIYSNTTKASTYILAFYGEAFIVWFTVPPSRHCHRHSGCECKCDDNMHLKMMECTEPRMLYNGKAGPHRIFLRKCKYIITVRVVISWYSTAYRTSVGCKSLFELTKDTSYFSLTGELCSVYDEELGEIKSMMTSSNGNIFHVTGHLCGEFTGHRWIPRTKANDGELWCFLWSGLE